MHYNQICYNLTNFKSSFVCDFFIEHSHLLSEPDDDPRNYATMGEYDMCSEFNHECLKALRILAKDKSQFNRLLGNISNEQTAFLINNIK